MRSLEDVLPNPIHPKLPDSTFEIIGGYKDAHAAKVASQLTVCYVNLNGLSDTKLDLLHHLVRQHNIDVLICVDSQLSEKEGTRYKKRTKAFFGPFSRVHFSTVKSEDSRRHKAKPRVGGVYCIVTPKWGQSLLTCVDDKTNLGVITCLPLRTADGVITIMGSYWPNRYTDTTASQHPHSLWSAVQSWLHHHNQEESPIDYTQRLSIQWITKAFNDGSQGVIYGGDLNATWTASEPGGCYVLAPWAAEHDLINGPLLIANHRNERFHTHQSGSWIDHILHAGPLGQIDILAAYVATGVEWHGLTDHRPIFASYRVSPPSTAPPVLPSDPPKRIELDRKNPRAIADFDEAMRALTEKHPPNFETSEEASTYLFKLERATVKIVERINRKYCKGHRSSFKDGWSPVYAAYKIHLQTFLEIRRHLAGKHRRHRWNHCDVAKQGI